MIYAIIFIIFKPCFVLFQNAKWTFCHSDNLTELHSLFTKQKSKKYWENCDNKNEQSNFLLIKRDKEKF